MTTETTTIQARRQGRDEAPVPARDERRNYALGVVNGAVGNFGRSFVMPRLVLAAFVFEMTGSNRMVGLLESLSLAGMFWPQLYFSRLIEHLPRKRPFYVLMTVLRSTALALMAGSIWLAVAFPGRWPVYAFFGAFFLYRSGDGGGGLAFYDLVGGTVRRGRLGGYFATRSLLGDALVLAASLLLIQPIIKYVAAPRSYAILATAGFAALTVAWGAMCFTREQEEDDPPAERRFWQTVREAAGVMVHDRSYRALIAHRVLSRITTLALAFFVPYGVERLGIVGASGLFVAFWSGSRLIGAPIWGRVVSRAGPRTCLIASGTLFGLSPILALLAPHLPRLFAAPLPLTDQTLDASVCAYLLSLCVFGVAFRGYMIGHSTFLVEGAPAARRASYIAFLNTVTFPLALLPWAAGWLIDGGVIRFDVLFAVAAVSGIASPIVALGLRRTRPPAREVP
ncbi:MAG: MFS transporter [Planctomycetota bacterium]|jgi:MFS family permease